MSVNSNLFLQHDGIVSSKDFFKIQKSIDNLITDLISKAIKLYPNDRNVLQQALIDLPNSISAEYSRYYIFVGDKDYIYHKDADSEVVFTDYFDDMMSENKGLCRTCGFSMNTIIRMILHRVILQNIYDAQLQLFELDDPIIRCKICGSSHLFNEFFPVKLIGNFKMCLPPFLFDYYDVNQILEFFGNQRENLHTEYYQYA